MKMSILKPKQTLVFEGDSLTRRSMAPSADNWPLLRLNNWHHSWADLVEEWIFAHRPDLQIKCRQSAIGGSSIINLEERYEAQVKPHRPAWILLTLGSNDRNARNIPVAEFRERFATCVLEHLGIFGSA
jgi:lysophospholipase L1-like esterase